MALFNQLTKLTWGMGIEHEMHIFHKPKGSNIKDIILFDSYTARQRLIKLIENGKIKISDEDESFLRSVPYEQTGRMCNGQWVIKKVPYNMPEFITSQPFCSIRTSRNIINMTMDIIKLKQKYIQLLMLDPVTAEQVKKYGELVEYPFGMTRYLKCPINSSLRTYRFTEKLLPEYTGSYHITLTLPYTSETTNDQFIKMHQNFANQLQWLEPLLLTSYFSGDQYAVGSAKKRVRGSFRVMMIGWGNFVGSDVRKFGDGIGRYGVIPIHWREGLDFHNLDKLKVCYKPSPSARKEKALTSLSSDFRTFGNPDPNRPDHRESGCGMTKPNGIEFRIFDQFNDAYIVNLVRLIGLVAENSRVHQTKGYVYTNKEWIHNMQEIMKYGYKTQITNGYKKLLRTKLGLKINTKSLNAHDVFKQICHEIYYKNYSGLWTKLFDYGKIEIIPMIIYNNKKIEKIFHDEIITPNVNQHSWFMAFFLKLNNNPALLEKFNTLIKSFKIGETLDSYTFELLVDMIMGKFYRDNYDDILYTLEYLGLIKLTKNSDGTLNKFTFIKHKKYKNFDYEMKEFFEIDSNVNTSNIFSKE
jgi:hypothetical protein